MEVFFIFLVMAASLGFGLHIASDSIENKVEKKQAIYIKDVEYRCGAVLPK